MPRTYGFVETRLATAPGGEPLVATIKIDIDDLLRWFVHRAMGNTRRKTTQWNRLVVVELKPRTDFVAFAETTEIRGMRHPVSPHAPRLG